MFYWRATPVRKSVGARLDQDKSKEGIFGTFFMHRKEGTYYLQKQTAYSTKCSVTIDLIHTYTNLSFPLIIEIRTHSILVSFRILNVAHSYGNLKQGS